MVPFRNECSMSISFSDDTWFMLPKIEVSVCFVSLTMAMVVYAIARFLWYVLRLFYVEVVILEM